MNLSWMNEIAEHEGNGAAYGSPYALEIDGRRFVYVSNGACLAAVEGELAEALQPPEDMRVRCLALLRARSEKSFDADFQRMVRWAELGHKPFCDTCDGLGIRPVPPPEGTTDPMPTTAWARCTGVCGGEKFERRIGNVSGYVYDLDLLHEILGYLTAERVMVGIVGLAVGRPLVVRSPAPLWKVMLMNRFHGDRDVPISDLPRFEP